MSPSKKEKQFGTPEARSPADVRKKALQRGSRIAAPVSESTAEVVSGLVVSEPSASKSEEERDSERGLPEDQTSEDAEHRSITISKPARRPKATTVQVLGSVPFQVVLAKPTKPGTRRNPRQLKLSPERKTVVTTIHFDEAVLACLSTAASTAKVRISHLVHQACIEWIKRVKLPMPEVDEAAEEKETG